MHVLEKRAISLVRPDSAEQGLRFATWWFEHPQLGWHGFSSEQIVSFYALTCVGGWVSLGQKEDHRSVNMEAWRGLAGA